MASSSSASALLSLSSHQRGIATSPSLPCLRSYHTPITTNNTNPGNSGSKLGMGSPLQAISSPPSPDHLQSHLYNSFLHRKTADVAIRVRGSWHAIYRLHRVVLIQAGFFQSLFTSGFLESKKKLLSDKSGPDVEVIDLVFDDPNITRAAFEICIARLYGGGPPLHISPSLIPTASQPLTSSFPHPQPPTPTPEGHHPATPRFLLSLLATAIYLHVPPVAGQALTAVLRTVGPYTVIRYLEFAIGKGIGERDEGDEEEPETAVGLEGVAQIVEDPEDDMAVKSASGDASASTSSLRTRVKSEEDISGTWRDGDHEIKKEDPADLSDGSHPSHCDSRTSHRFARPSTLAYSYGAVSDKVGEAAACWLTRWGADMLQYEQQLVSLDSSSSAQGSSSSRGHDAWTPAFMPVAGSSSSSSEGGGGGYGRKRATTVPSRVSAGTSELAYFQGITTRASVAEEAEMKIPVIWRKGGLSARWVRGLLSSDALFVKGEKERFELAKTIVEMWRTVKSEEEEEEEEEEEREWAELFANGIYYANMPVEDVMAISREISPRTGRPYLPLSVLQAAQWAQAELRNHIFTHRTHGASPPRSPISPTTPTGNANDHKLGLGLPARELVRTLHPDERKRLLHPVPEDWSLRIGDCTTLDGGLDPLFETIAPELYPPSSDSNSSGKKAALPTTEATFFGIRQSARFPDEASSDSEKERGAGANARWTAYPPFRFGVEFWDVDLLKEKSRLHSQTVWYAGSLYNVYVQLVRKKGIQLGVYLHRQSSVDPVPSISAPAPSAVPAPVPPSAFASASASASASAPAPASNSGTMSAASTSGITPVRPASRHSSHASPGLPISRSITPVTPGSPVLSRSFPSSSPAASYAASSTSSTSPTTPAASAGGTYTTTLPHTVPSTMPPQAYRDPRSAVSAYFSVACASATGGSLTRFASAPDVFSVSQSWGWKSSSLRTEEYIEISDAALLQSSTEQSGSMQGIQGGRTRGAKGREASLRATVVLGVV